jgi:hypothetical protein
MDLLVLFVCGIDHTRFSIPNSKGRVFIQGRSLLPSDHPPWLKTDRKCITNLERLTVALNVPSFLVAGDERALKVVAERP